jgi:hypothetical protein
LGKEKISPKIFFSKNKKEKKQKEKKGKIRKEKKKKKKWKMEGEKKKGRRIFWKIKQVLFQNIELEYCRRTKLFFYEVYLYNTMENTFIIQLEKYIFIIIPLYFLSYYYRLRGSGWFGLLLNNLPNVLLYTLLAALVAALVVALTSFFTIIKKKIK